MEKAVKNISCRGNIVYKSTEEKSRDIMGGM